ncbi:MAG: ABC transporter permease [Deltaproteobacteria bacterium]|nr:ABC transporter permease [Deltaproteobacteria bacterium]
MTQLIETIGELVRRTVQEVGRFFSFALSFFRWLFVSPFRWSLLRQQMEFLGVQSFPVIALTGLFTGMVFALQTAYAFRLFNAESLIGSTVGLALSREIGPVFTALMVTARAGSAMAAEIGSMRVTEQVDALESMAVNPVHYLVVPRVVAGFVMVPLLYGFFIFIGIIGSYFVAVSLLGLPEAPFFHKLYYYVDMDDIVGGMMKASVFGLLLTLLSCHRGYRTSGGAQGVGRATTQAVVISSVVILVMDYFLTAWILEFFPEF